MLQAVKPPDLAEGTLSDQTLQLIAEHVRNGWPPIRPTDPAIDGFYQVRDALSISISCIYRDNRAVIPASLQQRILQLAHEGHCGIQKTKQRCRECVCWPGIYHHIEQVISNCTACIVSDKGRHSLPTPSIKPMQYPPTPRRKLAIDIVGEIHGNPQNARYLIVVTDLHSKWPEVKAVASITTSSIVGFLSEMFARWSVPEEIISDNGRQFVSRDFEQFLNQLNIKHSKTALYHSQSNCAV